MQLHKPVVFVGDRPNVRRNVNLDVPFVGTASYKRILDWIYRMDLDINNVSLTNAYDLHGNEVDLLALFPDLQKRKIVALGGAALERLKEFSTCSVYKLPHPSGSNPQANDGKALTATLLKCKKWIYEELEVR